MKFQKSVIAFAVATAITSVAGTAFAGSVAPVTNNTYAVEAIKAGTISTVAIPGLGYNPGQNVAPNTTFTVYVRLDSGAKWSSVPALVDVTYDTINPTSITLSADGKYFGMVFTTGATSIPTSAALNISNATAKMDLTNATALATSGGVVNVDFAFTLDSSANTTTFPTTSLDTASGVIANSANAIATTVVPSSAYGSSSNATLSSLGNETNSFIDVNATPAFTNFTTGSLTASQYVNLGAVVLSEVPGIQKKADGSDFLVSDLDASEAKFDVAGNFITSGYEKLGLYSTSDCSTTAVSAYATPATASTASFTGLTFTVNTPVYVCAETDTGVTPKAAIPVTQPTIAAVNLYANAKLVNSSGAGTLYNLTQNGASAQLINYVPAAAAPYQTYVRVANNSSLTAPVTVAVIGANGTTLGSGTLNASMAPGASMTYSAAQVETAAGVTLPAADRVQVLLTAPVPGGKLNAQAFLADPNGGFSNMTSNK